MASSSLSPQSVADKLTELYSLSDPLLTLQAAAIAFDFRWWVRNNFDLDAEQRIYLKAMNNTAANFFGHQCSIAFLHRADISLVYPAPPTTPGYGKWTELISSLVVATSNTGQITVGGSLQFVISYKI